MKDNIVKKTSGMWSSTLEELTATYKQLGLILRREVDKEIIFRNRGPWASVAFKYQNRVGDEWGPVKVMLAFFKNVDGMYKRYSYYNIRSKEEALKIIKFLIKSFNIGELND